VYKAYTGLLFGKMQGNHLQVKALLRKFRNEPLLFLTLFIVVSTAVFLIFYPLLRVILYPTAGEYAGFFLNRRWIESLRNSVVMMLLSMLTCTALAFLFAYGIVRLRLPGQNIFRFITLLPIVSPPFIVALSYILLFGAQGLITKRALGLAFNIYGWQGLWGVQTISFFPYAYAVIEGVMDAITPNMEYAARNLGAPRFRTFRDVFFPLCRPGIAGGAMMAAINVLADFGNPSMIAGNFRLLPTEAYMQMAGWYNMSGAAVLSTILLLPTFSLFVFNRYWLGKRSYTTLTGKETFLPPLKSAPIIKWTVFAGCLLVSVFVLLVYGILLVGAFSKTWGYDWSFDFSSFVYVWKKRNLIKNSLRYAMVSAVLASIAALALAWLVERGMVHLKKILDFIAVLPGAVPGVFLGLGFAIALGPPPFRLASSPLIMIAALAVWNIPTCYSADSAGFQQIGGSIEQAAKNLGASSGRAIRDILFPILHKTLLAGFMLSFLRSMTCLSVVIFIYGVSTTVSTVSILSLVNSGDWSGAAAFTVVIIAIAFTVMGLFKLLSNLIAVRHKESKKWIIPILN
jgi:iron(III) transport system permease protein